MCQSLQNHQTNLSNEWKQDIIIYPKYKLNKNIPLCNQCGALVKLFGAYYHEIILARG